MEHLPENPSRFKQAVELQQNGYRLVALRPESKQPLHKGWQARDYSEVELQNLLEKDNGNVGIKTGGDLIVVDVDSTNQGKIDWVLQKVGDTPMQARSPSGGLHLYYRTRASVHYGNAVKLRGVYDLRWDGCFIVCPPSKSAQGIAYEWIGEVLPVKELPVIRVTPLRRKKRTGKVAPRVCPSAVCQRTATAARGILHPENYCLKIPSVQGQNGSGALVRTICILRDAGRTVEEAMEFLRTRWNPMCAKPEWSEEELRHAVNRHFGVS